MKYILIIIVVWEIAKWIIRNLWHKLMNDGEQD
jgi:hypothetical protein